MGSDAVTRGSMRKDVSVKGEGCTVVVLSSWVGILYTSGVLVM